MRLLSSPLHKIFRSSLRSTLRKFSAPSLLKTAEDKVSRKGDELAQVLVSKFVGNLVRVYTGCKTEKPEVIPVMRKCPLSTMVLVRAAKCPCTKFCPFFAEIFLHLVLSL